MADPRQLERSTIIGGSLLYLFTGIALLHASIYFRTFKRDPLFMKVFVALNCFFTIVYSTSTVYLQLEISMVPEDKPVSSQVSGALTGGSRVIGTTVNHLTQAYFIWRLHSLSRRPLVSYPLWALTLACFVMVVVLSVLGIKNPDEYDIVEYDRRGWLHMVPLAIDTVIDQSTAVLLCWWFRRQINDDIFKETRDIIGRLSVFAIQTGLLTSLESIAALITYFASPDKSRFLVMYLPLPASFLIALIASLNNRLKLSTSAVKNDSFPLANTSSRSELVFQPLQRIDDSNIGDNGAKNMLAV